MKISLKTIFSCLTLFLVSSVYGQTEEVDSVLTRPNFLYHYGDAMKIAKVDYTLPEGFKHEFFDEGLGGDGLSQDQEDYLKQNYHWLRYLSGKVSSQEDNFMILFCVCPETYAIKVQGWRDTKRENAHLMSIAFDLDMPHRSPNYKSIREKVRYYPHEYAKTAYNADTVIIYQIPISESTPYINYRKHYKKTDIKYSTRNDSLTYYSSTCDSTSYHKYNHCKVVILQKDDDFISMSCLYNDEAAKNLDYYMKAIEGIFRYRED